MCPRDNCPLKNLVLVDRPSIALSRGINAVTTIGIEQPRGYDDDGLQSLAQVNFPPLSDGLFLNVLGSATWWDSGDKIIVDGIGARSFHS